MLDGMIVTLLGMFLELAESHERDKEVLTRGEVGVSAGGRKDANSWRVSKSCMTLTPSRGKLTGEMSRLPPRYCVIGK